MTYGHVTTLWSACCECGAVTRNWVRARHSITRRRAVECVYGVRFDCANYLTVKFTFGMPGRELIERDMPVFESPCFIDL